MMIGIVLVLLAQGAETPDYKYWSGCKPGSWVRCRIDQKTPEYELTQVVTIRLLSVDAEGAKVELTQRVYSGENTISATVGEKRVPARVTAELGIVKESDEILEIAGRKLSCRRSDVRREVGGVPFKMSFWTCPDVPGGTVKSEGGSAGEKDPLNRMVVLEWRKESSSGVDEISTCKEAKSILKQVEETLFKARTLRFDYTHTFEGKTGTGRFAREGDKIFYTLTCPRSDTPLTHTRVSNGTELLFYVNGERKGIARKTYAGMGANAVTLMLYAIPSSLDPWFEVEEGAPPREREELTDIRVRGRVKLGQRETIILERLTGHPKPDRLESLWIDTGKHVPLKRESIYSREKIVFSGRLEDTYSNYVIDESLDASTFVVPKE